MRGLTVNEDKLIKNTVFDGIEIDIPYNKFASVVFVYVDSRCSNKLGECFVNIDDIKFKNNLYYNKANGKYYYIWGNGERLPGTIYHYVKNVGGPGRYRSFELNYSCNDLLNRFNIAASKDRIINDRLQSFLKYSFGLEFETSSGMIPEHLCYQYGLIPLRDGSISGFEYSTIVLGKTYGLSLLKKQLEILRQYTSFDKECSLHIHFGKLPNNIRFVFTLYKLCYIFENNLSELLPQYAFKTSKFKKSKKDYCKRLEHFDTMSQMYNYYIENADLYVNEEDIDTVDLNLNHPYDSNRSRKWNIHSRYHWVNFINLLFYKNHKTVEFRCLNPTRNFNKIVTWIYIFISIINIAEKLFNNFKNLPLNDFYKNLNDELAFYVSYPFISIILEPFYNGLSRDKINKIRRAINNLYLLKEKQVELRDYIGEHYELDDIICTTGFIK